MLVMRRREGEAIQIGDSVEVRILAVNGSRVKIGITAPRLIKVQPKEVELVRAENQAAARISQADAANILATLCKTLPAAPPVVPALTLPEIGPQTANKMTGG
jgi:carbon storage regulator